MLHGPRGSGKAELAEEIVRRLPSRWTRTVHRLSADDGLDFVDTVLGTAEHPGLLDDLADRANATLVLRGFASVRADSKERYDRRRDLVRALVGLARGEYHSAYRNETRPFLPRLVGCTQREPEYFRTAFGDGGAGADATIFVSVPSFEKRTRDLEDIALGKIEAFERGLGLSGVALGEGSTRRLLDHRWGTDPDAELDAELYESLARLAAERRWNPFAANAIEPRHLLVNAYNEKIRRRLLDEVPLLRRAINSPWVFGDTLRYIVPPVFVAVNAILFLGPQVREENAVLTIFWAGWVSYLVYSFHCFIEEFSNVIVATF